jgi:hypothetical protein
MIPPAPTTAALSDVHARPRTGPLVQVLALLLTAAPVLAVALWAATVAI